MTNKGLEKASKGLEKVKQFMQKNPEGDSAQKGDEDEADDDGEGEGEEHLGVTSKAAMTTATDTFLHELEQAASQPLLTQASPPQPLLTQASPPPKVRVKMPKVATVAVED